MASKGEVINRDQPFRHIMRDRILIEMLRSSKSAGGAGRADSWKVLITDSFTLRVISASCKMPDVTEEGISLVEDLNRRRQPQPFMDGLYFIQPTQQSLNLFQKDMQGKDPAYKRAHVYFSRPLPKEFLQVIKDDPQLRSRIAALREMNLEVLTVDSQGFVTDNGGALGTLFGSELNGREYERTIHEIATRLGTVFASLLEFPTIRYKAAKVTSAGAGSAQRMRDMVPSKVAAVLWERLCKYKTDIAEFPQKETCDLLIVDRSFDPITPVIHDWSYGSMCFDLLPLDGNKFEYQTTAGDGKGEKKSVLLDEHDPVWVDTRDLFMAEAYKKVQQIFNDVSGKLAAKDNLSGAQMQELVRNMALYQEQKEKVGLHLHICSVLGKKINQEGLNDLGELEQGLVYGEKGATYKELLKILKDNEDSMSPHTKLRLLLIYAATNPGKLDEAKIEHWSQLAGLSNADTQALRNLEFLGIRLGTKGADTGEGDKGSAAKPALLSAGLAFGAKVAGISASSGLIRKERKRAGSSAEEEEYSLARFYPALQDIIEDLVSGELSQENFPLVQASAAQAPVAAVPQTPPPPITGSSSARSSRPTSSAAPPLPSQTPSPAPQGLGKASMSVRKKALKSDSGSSSGSSSSSFSSSGGSSLASWALKSAGGGKDSARSSPERGRNDSASSARVTSARGSARGGGGVNSLASAAGNLSLGSSGGGGSGRAGAAGSKRRRLVVFVVGGMSRAELRMAHVLSQRLNRDVILGSTSLDTPIQFLEKLKALH